MCCYADESDAQDENGTSTPQLAVRKGMWHFTVMVPVWVLYFVVITDINGPQEPDGDSAYNTYSMPGDSDSHSSEPYSEINDTAESGI